jgi:tetratricopeptide (TPR) repeat protein
MEPLASVMLGAGPTVEPSLEAGSEYDFPLFKAFSAARRYAASAGAAKSTASRAERQAPPLRAASKASRHRDEKTERDQSLCWKLIDRCQAIRFTDPEAMVLTASLAVNLAERLVSSNAGDTELADLHARALGELGNARRIVNRLAEAEKDLTRALVRAGEGTGSPMLLAHLMDLTASLYTDQRRFDEARVLLDGVYAIYDRLGERHLAGRALISKAVSVSDAFEIEEAVQLFSQGLAMVDPVRDPKLVMRCVFNLIWTRLECGQASEAEALFKESRTLFAAYIERMDAVKITWLEARIASALRDDSRAEQLFREVRSSFENSRMPYGVALVSLDMAGLWLRTGRYSEIMELVEETIGIFREHGIRREAIGMLLIVREAIQKRRITEALLRSTAADLLRVEELRAPPSRVSS